MQERYIETPEQLDALCDLIRSSTWLALDTEFIREKTYYPQLCLLQICNGEIAACIDPLRLENLEPLLKILMDESIVKVFHSGRQDLEIFHHLWKRLPAPLFDTQLAATLLGMGEQIGYANLVEQLLGIGLSKSHTRTDWSRRPLGEGQLRYAMDDVVYLGKIYLLIKSRLEELGRSDWMNEEFELLANGSSYVADPQEAWSKIRGILKLKGPQLAVLQVLAAWRETKAMKSNRPKRWIAKDELLVDLARRQPSKLSQLESLRGLEGNFLKREGENLLDLIRQGRGTPKNRWPVAFDSPPRLSANQEAITDLLSCCLRLLADAHQMTPTALASRKSLELLVSGKRDLELMRGWRKKLAGEHLLEVLNGARTAVVKDGKVELTAVSR